MITQYKCTAVITVYHSTDEPMYHYMRKKLVRNLVRIKWSPKFSGKCNHDFQFGLIIMLPGDLNL